MLLVHYVESACYLFVNNLLPHAKKYLITTETAKNNILEYLLNLMNSRD